MSLQKTDLERIRALLDSQEKAIPAEQLSKLNVARQNALEAVSRRRRWRLPLFGGLLSTAACAGMAFLLLGRAPTPVVEAVVATTSNALQQDQELLADADNLDMLQDLEFYTWLQQQPQGG
jgi:ferric-dicitrate binding protein FerR (iron transport regulator)